jgi:hypothetical protein
MLWYLKSWTLLSTLTQWLCLISTLLRVLFWIESKKVTNVWRKRPRIKRVFGNACGRIVVARGAVYESLCVSMTNLAWPGCGHASICPVMLLIDFRLSNLSKEDNQTIDSRVEKSKSTLEHGHLWPANRLTGFLFGSTCIILMNKI